MLRSDSVPAGAGEEAHQRRGGWDAPRSRATGCRGVWNGILGAVKGLLRACVCMPVGSCRSGEELCLQGAPQSVQAVGH